MLLTSLSREMWTPLEWIIRCVMQSVGTGALAWFLSNPLTCGFGVLKVKIYKNP